MPALVPRALVALADELRPEVVQTIAAFTAEGVAHKILSGDDPDTVAAQADLIAALTVSVLSGYFGMTRPAGIVYMVVLPTLLPWFLTLASAYRLRLMDRVFLFPRPDEELSTRAGPVRGPSRR